MGLAVLTIHFIYMKHTLYGNFRMDFIIVLVYYCAHTLFYNVTYQAYDEKNTYMYILILFSIFYLKYDAGIVSRGQIFTTFVEIVTMNEIIL